MFYSRSIFVYGGQKAGWRFKMNVPCCCRLKRHLYFIFLTNSDDVISDSQVVSGKNAINRNANIICQAQVYSFYNFFIRSFSSGLIVNFLGPV